MKFIYEEHDDYTSFTAVPENEKERDGFRAQGPYAPISLKEDTLIVKYVSKNTLHPDIVAAICITAFYPFIHSSATMPFPVSKRFADGLQMDILPQHGKIEGVYRATEPITIDNIDINLEPYTGGSNSVIAYGGGMDSTAIACLFPDYDLIHSTDIDNKDNTVREFVEDNLENKIHIIESNCKYLATPKGFTTFTNIYITPLIMCADLDIQNIMCGAIMESTCLSNGAKYFPQFDPTRRNRWERFYNHIGLCMFSPTSGCSELITSKIICKYNLQNKVIYCDRNNGKPCSKCTKCLRKQLELAYHGVDVDFDSFEEFFITNFLKKRPLFMGHVFIETIKNLIKRYSLPKCDFDEKSEITSDDEVNEWYYGKDDENGSNRERTKEQEESREKILNIFLYLDDAISDVRDIETSLFNNIYAKSFQYFPDDIKDHIIERLSSVATIMSPDEEKYLEKWDITVKPVPVVENITVITQVETETRCSSDNESTCELIVVSDDEESTSHSEAEVEVEVEAEVEAEPELQKEQVDLMTELRHLREENARLKINSNTIRNYLLQIFQLIECDTDTISTELNSSM